MTTSASSPDAPRLVAALRYSGWFMLVVGTLALALSALGADGAGIGGVLVLAGTGMLLPNDEKVAKVSLALAGAVLGIAFAAGALL